MKVIADLVKHNMLNAYRRVFYKKLIVSSIILFAGMIYSLFVLIKGSYYFLDEFGETDLIMELVSVKVIFLIAFSDLIFKLVFSNFSISNVYPYLRLKIQKSDLVKFIILSNHLSAHLLIDLVFLVPVAIVCSGKFTISIMITLLLSLSLIFICNNYISMIYNLFKLKIHYLFIIPLIFFFLLIVSGILINYLIEIQLELSQLRLMLIILVTICLICLFHEIVKKELIKILYMS